MSQKIFHSILLIFISTINAFEEDPSKSFTLTCRTDFCKEALESQKILMEVEDVNL
jgi:hypothetical protein